MTKTYFQNPPKKSRRNREIDLVAVGELLIDLIGVQLSNNLADAETFQRFQGGSPANFAANLARLQNKSALIAVVGNENLGQYLINQVAKTGIITDYIITDSVAPTTVVLVSRTLATPDFIAYRTADRMILPEHIPDEVLKKSTFYHTTCFALSQQPAQKSIVEGAKKAALFGCKISIDVNYAPSIWGNRVEAQQIISEICATKAFVKMSLDDIQRLFDDENIDAQHAIGIFHDWGAELVCLTKGANGCTVSWENGKQYTETHARKIETVNRRNRRGRCVLVRIYYSVVRRL